MISKVSGMQGSECQIHFEMKDKKDGTPLNLTGGRVKSVLKYAPGDSDEESIVVKTTDPGGDIVIEDAKKGKGTVYFRAADTAAIPITGTRNIFTQVCATIASGQVTESPNVMLVLEESIVKTPLAV